MSPYPSRESLKDVLARLGGLLAMDTAFVKGSRGKNYTIRLGIVDLDIAFHIYFCDGTVESGVGEPADAPAINVTMNSNTFDDVFGGRVNPARAAMKGDIIFSGDMTTALRFQGMLPDFVRLYKQARTEES